MSGYKRIHPDALRLRLRELQRQMYEVANEVAQFQYFDPEAIIHANELRGAAYMVRKWEQQLWDRKEVME